MMGNCFTRNSWQSNNRFWKVYNDGKQCYYITSLDGEKWSTETVICRLDANNQPVNSQGGCQISCYYDVVNNYVHFAVAQFYYADSSHYSPLYYFRGRPEDNGTITWTPGHINADGTPELQIVYGANDSYWYCPTICCGDDGKPAIGACYGTAGYRKPYVWKSDATDGTWHAVLDTYQLNSTGVTGSEYWVVQLFPIRDGTNNNTDILVIYARSASTTAASRILATNGSISGATVFNMSYLPNGSISASMSNTGAAMFCYIRAGTLQIRANAWGRASGWIGDGLAISTNLDSTSRATVSWDNGAAEPYIFWTYTTGGHVYVYWTRYTSGAWTPAALLFQDDYMSCYSINSSYDDSKLGEEIILSWEDSNTGNPVIWPGCIRLFDIPYGTHRKRFVVDIVLENLLGVH